MLTKEEYYPFIKKASESLKDFQALTVDYVYDQLYVKGRRKMLIADEVGLGKTVVAKGIIAKSLKWYLDNYKSLKRDNPTFNVVYICSNLALADQNIKKLNFTGDNSVGKRTIDRLNYLAYKEDEAPPLFKIDSLTPGTSFDQKSSSGQVEERAIIFALLMEYEVFDRRSNGLRWILKGLSNIQKWDEIKDRCYNERHQKIRKDLFKKFRDELVGVIVSKEKLPRVFNELQTTVETTLWKALQILSDKIDGRNEHQFDFQNEMVRELRRILSYLCLEYLGADIFILDEFQRYSSLIKSGQDSNPSIELAKKVFQVEGAKVIMLSATPFKPYTNDFDEASGEVHYQEFKSVLKFLLDDEVDSFWSEFEEDRKSLYKILRHSDKLATVFDSGLVLKDKLESTYRKAIVRTERLMASENKDAMIRHADAGKTLKIQIEDIHDFVILDKITQHLNKRYDAGLNVPIEYVKSCPYALSFLDTYQHKEKLRKQIGDDKELQNLLKQSTHAWLDLGRIANYMDLIPSRGKILPNAKLRLLIEKTINSKAGNGAPGDDINQGWKYLWVPPSLPYYELSGPFAESWGFSKSLIFSAWKMVPKMVAGLVSYEAERLTVGDKNSISDKEQQDENERREYFQRRRTPRAQFTFKNSLASDTPDEMNNFMLIYPSLYLSKLYNPINNLSEKQTIKQIRKQIILKIRDSILQSGILEIGKPGGDIRKWFWLAPILLDKTFSDVDLLTAWLNNFNLDDLTTNSEEYVTEVDEGKGRAAHRNFVSAVLNGSKVVEVGKPGEEQLEEICAYLADLVLGSPAICVLRSLLNHFTLSRELLVHVNMIGSAFITLFNKPESIAIMRLTTDAKEYYRSVLEYCVAGNMQSMLDEYVYLLNHCDSLTNSKQVADHLSDILSLRTSNVPIDDYKSFRDSAVGGEADQEKRSLRTHYAMDFGSQKSNASGSNRLVNIRESFNSPFRPFVLATTSIGQEGLDFHYYCRKIFHWNLPSNPIDFEQREGRIHRYKGHVIRLNLAKKYGPQVTKERDTNIWDTIFETASPEKMLANVQCDLIPFWHINHGTAALNIERYVPIYPFSKDIEKFKNLIKVLTYYRLTFGQPRQEDLVDSLSAIGYDSEEITMLDGLMMNLSPMHFHKLAERVLEVKEDANIPNCTLNRIKR
jgi:hypothetical protein